MSKKKSGKIPVEIIELSKPSDELSEFEVRVQKEAAGTVKQIAGGQALVTFKSGHEQKDQTVDEGIEAVLMDYNLHNL